MPSNPSKCLLKARQEIARQLSEGDVSYSKLVLDVLVNHPVPDNYPEHFIKEHFLDKGLFVVEGDIIRRVDRG